MKKRKKKRRIKKKRRGGRKKRKISSLDLHSRFACSLVALEEGGGGWQERYVAVAGCGRRFDNQ
jgi:hypothetical protein